MNELQQRLTKVVKTAKAVVYPDREALKKQWKAKAEQDKIKQTAKK